MSSGREFVPFTGAHYRLGDSMAHEAAQSSQDSSIIVESSDEEVEQPTDVIGVIEALGELSRLSTTAKDIWMHHLLPKVALHEVELQGPFPGVLRDGNPLLQRS